MDFENIFKEIGQFGRGQQIQFFLLCLPVVFAAFISLDITLIAGTPKHQCRVSNDTEINLRSRIYSQRVGQCKDT